MDESTSLLTRQAAKRFGSSNLSPSANAEGRAEAIPVSRQHHLLRSPTRCKQPGRKPVRCTGQNGSERDLKADGVEMDGIQPVSTAGRNEVISESRCSRVGQGATGTWIGSSVRPREGWERMKAE